MDAGRPLLLSKEGGTYELRGHEGEVEGGGVRKPLQPASPLAGEAVGSHDGEEGTMICLQCQREIELGKRVFVIPFSAYAEDAFLFAHPDFMPNLEGRESVLDGYYVEGSGQVFVPREMVEALKGDGKSKAAKARA